MRGINISPGKAPPKAKNERYVPTTGIDWIIACAILIPVPDNKSSGSE